MPPEAFKCAFQSCKCSSRRLALTGLRRTLLLVPIGRRSVSSVPYHFLPRPVIDFYQVMNSRLILRSRKTCYGLDGPHDDPQLGPEDREEKSCTVGNRRKAEKDRGCERSKKERERSD